MSGGERTARRTPAGPGPGGRNPERQDEEDDEEVGEAEAVHLPVGLAPAPGYLISTRVPRTFWVLRVLRNFGSTSSISSK
jgi:hypothetical protein